MEVCKCDWNFWISDGFDYEGVKDHLETYSYGPGTYHADCWIEVHRMLARHAPFEDILNWVQLQELDEILEDSIIRLRC